MLPCTSEAAYRPLASWPQTETPAEKTPRSRSWTGRFPWSDDVVRGGVEPPTFRFSGGLSPPGTLILSLPISSAHRRFRWSVNGLPHTTAVRLVPPRSVLAVDSVWCLLLPRARCGHSVGLQMIMKPGRAKDECPPAPGGRHGPGRTTPSQSGFYTYERARPTPSVGGPGAHPGDANPRQPRSGSLAWPDVVTHTGTPLNRDPESLARWPQTCSCNPVAAGTRLLARSSRRGSELGPADKTVGWTTSRGQLSRLPFSSYAA